MNEIIVKEIKNDFKLALQMFRDKDLKDFDIDDSERDKVFRIGYYLQKIIEPKDIYNKENLVVDCEYNRINTKNGRKSKKMESLIDDKHNGIVIPDLIVHQRNISKNLLVCEFKNKETSGRDKDKLHEFKYNELFGYKYVCSVEFKNLFNTNMSIEEIIEEYK